MWKRRGSEIAIAGVAIGAAMTGMRPIADVQYGDFLFCMMDQLANQAAKDDVHVRRHGQGPDGDARAGRLDAARVAARAEPGSLFHAHSRPQSAGSVHGLRRKGLLKSAVRDENPVLIFEHKLLYGSKGGRSEQGALSAAGEVPEEEYLVPIGKGVVRREGRDVTIVGKLLTVYPRWARRSGWRRRASRPR